jgi:four helix bundle protein
MSGNDLQVRTRLYALRVIRLVESLPRGRTADVIGRQLVRCATSVGANYRAACRARSNNDFIAKMKIVEEEGDESLYWLSLLVDAGLLPEKQVQGLLQEGDEIVAMTVASVKTARGNKP